MAYIAIYQDKEYKVDVKPQSEGVYKVFIYEGEILIREMELDVRRHGCCTYSVLADNKSYEVDLEEKDKHLYEVLIECEHYELKVMDEFKMKLEKLLHGDVGVAEGEVKTSMTGKVTKVFVAEGDHVKKGQPLVILEAMKMENEFKAPKDGVVKAVKVKEGDVVNTGAVLVVIE
jgi:biotin carboxyl carrier protein